MIKERYCSSEVSKLLKKKGFDEPCYRWYDSNGDICAKFINPDIPLNYLSIERYLCPTHQMACDWLGDIHDLYIIAYPYKRGNSKGWCCYVYKTYNLLGQERYMNETCNSCYEAIEAALKYSLENLI